MYTILGYELVKLCTLLISKMNYCNKFFMSYFALTGSILLHISITGYTVFWITGTQDYLWPIVAGLYAICCFVQEVKKKDSVGILWKIVSIVCCIWAAFGQEQTAAVLLGFSLVLFLFCLTQKKPVQTYHVIQIVIFISGCLFLTLSPLAQKRLENTSMLTTVSFGNRLFLTYQWFLSSCANEMKNIFILLWFLLTIILFKNKNKSYIVTAIFAVLSGLSHFGITICSDLGVIPNYKMGVRTSDIIVLTSKLVLPKDMTIQNWFAFVFWSSSFIVMAVIFMNINKNNNIHVFILLLIEMAALASPMLLAFSASMYLSGGRPMYLTALLLIMIIVMLCSCLKGYEKGIYLVTWNVLLLLQIILEIPYLLSAFSSSYI